MKTGDRHYRAFVGADDYFDISGADQFNLLTTKGLREHHKLLDIGCGSLRAGRLFIPYLLKGNYFGLEPEKWLVEAGINNILGEGIIETRSPNFLYNWNFDFRGFDTQFDFLVACSIFSHASQSQIAKCLTSASSVMHNSSLFFASFKEGDSNYVQDRWAYPEVISYRFDWMKNQAASLGLNSVKIDWVSPHLQTWIAFSKDENIDNFKDFNAFLAYRDNRKLKAK